MIAKEDIEKIIGIKVKGIIYSGDSAVSKLNDGEKVQRLVTLMEAKSKAYEDIGNHLEKLVVQPILFKYSPEAVKKISFDEQTMLKDSDCNIVRALESEERDMIKEKDRIELRCML